MAAFPTGAGSCAKSAPGARAAARTAESIHRWTSKLHLLPGPPRRPLASFRSGAIFAALAPAEACTRRATHSREKPLRASATRLRSLLAVAQGLRHGRLGDHAHRGRPAGERALIGAR